MACPQEIDILFMSIVTKTGDEGMTGLMYNQRVPKTDARVEAYGCVDELNAAIGMARSVAQHSFLKENLPAIQKDLVIVMGELATDPSHIERYIKDGFTIVNPDLTVKLERLVADIERQNITYRGWATPGANPCSACLDLARTVCRRAERRAWGLHEAGNLDNKEIMVFLNRLSDLLWLMARWVETQAET